MSILDRLDKDPEVWKPQPGDRLVGLVVELETRTTEYGDYPCLTVMDDDGTEWMFHAFHTVAKNELAKKRPVVGDSIGIKYIGKDNAAKYEKYRVIVEHAEPQPVVAPDWTAIGVEASTELASADIPLDDPVQAPAFPTGVDEAF